MRNKIFFRRWEKEYDNARANLEYPKGSMVDALMEVARKYPEYFAYEYFGNKVTFRNFMKQIENCAKALKNYGVGKGDVVTICEPSLPEGIIAFYATNLIGAVASMVHPLSSEVEIEKYINDSNSHFLITIDLALEKVLSIKMNTRLHKIVVTNAASSMPSLMHTLYHVTNYKKKVKIPKDDDDIVLWSTFIGTAKDFVGVCYDSSKEDDLAVILYSGGTTGTPKGIMLSNKAFNAVALGAREMITEILPGNSALCILPIFHGFGLAVNVHTPLLSAMKIILIPRFNVNEFYKLFKIYKPNFLVGVPTLYEALLKQKLGPNGLDCLDAVISGGDLLSPELKKKVDDYLLAHGSKAKVRPGYGLTEATAAVCLTKEDECGDAEIGIPFPDTCIKIVQIGTLTEAAPNEDGEICVSGPSVMLGYLNNDKETNDALRQHDDGKIWLHTGDIGSMDERGHITFKQRLKRMIITSGYNVYPSYIENIIVSHKDVLSCTVVGVPHPYKGQTVKAYVVLQEGVEESGKLKKEILELCKKNVARYAIPKEIEFRKKLPTTLVGKVKYSELEKENNK